MAKRKKSNFKDTTQESVMSDFIQVDLDPAQIDLEDLIKEETKPYTEEERAGVVDVPNSDPKFKNPNTEIALRGSVEKITNENLTESVKQMLINANICSDSDFI